MLESAQFCPMSKSVLKWGNFARKKKLRNDWVFPKLLLLFLLIHQGQSQSKPLYFYCPFNILSEQFNACPINKNHTTCLIRLFFPILKVFFCIVKFQHKSYFNIVSSNMWFVSSSNFIILFLKGLQPL